MKVIYNKDRGILPHFSGNSPLLESPIVIYVNDFNERSAKDFIDKVSKAHNTGQTIIPVVIDSYGGHVHSLVSMMTAIDHSHLPVATMAVGKAMSCGALLLGYGDAGLRYTAKDTRIMLHDVAAGARGKLEDMKISVKETEKLSKQVFQKLAVKCGYKDKNYFIKLLEEKKHLDFYMEPSTARKMKLVDHITIPDLHVNVTLDMDLK